MDDFSLYGILVKVPAILLGIGLHEWSHAYVADRAGDPVPRQQGRLTLDLVTHLDPIGTLGLLLGPLGWGRPVQVNPANFDDPVRDHVRVALAGPLANLVVMAAGLVVLSLVPLLGLDLVARGAGRETLAGMLFWIIFLNMSLALFNLVPIPPLDGSRVVRYWMPREPSWMADEGAGILLILILGQLGAFRPLYSLGTQTVLTLAAWGPWATLAALVLTALAWALNAGLVGRGPGNRYRPR